MKRPKSKALALITTPPGALCTTSDARVIRPAAAGSSGRQWSIAIPIGPIVARAALARCRKRPDAIPCTISQPPELRSAVLLRIQTFARMGWLWPAKTPKRLRPSLRPLPEIKSP